MSDQRPWYDTAFEGGYLEVYPHRDLASARAEIAGLLAHGPALAGRVLDLGCGHGRHLLALRERGLDAYGLDRSAALLRRAAGFEPLRGRLVRGDFRHLPYRPASFGAVLMLFSSFGYFDERDNARVLEELARVSAPGALLVLDLMNAGRVRSQLVPESLTRRDGLELHERRHLTPDGRRVVKQVLLRGMDGRERRWHEDVRLFEPEEIDGLLRAAGLEPESREGDFHGRPFDEQAPRQLVRARRL